MQNLTKSLGKKYLEGLAYHLPVVDVVFILQLFMEFGGDNFHTALV
jgi:hypothetical protein